MSGSPASVLDSTDISVFAERINPDQKATVAQGPGFHGQVRFTDVKANWAFASGRTVGRFAWHGRQSALHYVFHFVLEGEQVHNGASLKAPRLVIYAPSAELAAQTPARATWAAVGLAPALAAPILARLRVPPGRTTPEAVLLRASPRAWAGLARAAVAAMGATAGAPLGGPPPDRLLPGLLAALAGVVERGKELAPARTITTISRAEAYLGASAGRRVSLAELAAAVGLGERALRQAYLKAYGMSPKVLHKARLLAQARARLRTADRRGSVSDVAARLGIYSFGRFSVEYRRLYGESPSKTLSRGTRR